MRTKVRLAMIAFSVAIAATLIISFGLNGGIGKGSKISPELKELMARSSPTDPISVWVEFDTDEYRKVTNSSFSAKATEYWMSGGEKLRRNATDELLPVEVMGFVFLGAKSLQPPVEVYRPHFHWYVTELQLFMIERIDNFPGVLRIHLREPSQGISDKVDPILVPYMGKVAKEYPSCRIKIIVDISTDLHVNPDTGEWSETIDYNGTRAIVERSGGEIADYWPRGVLAVVPPNPQILVELSELSNVAEVRANWGSHAAL